MITIRGRAVVPGTVEGEALVSHEPISGWGGIDPARGVIIEPRHELFGQCFTGKILVFPSAKGSSGWSGFFQSTRLLGTAPIGMIFARVSTKSALGAVVTRVPSVTDLDARPLRGDQDRGLGAHRRRPGRRGGDPGAITRTELSHGRQPASIAGSSGGRPPGPALRSNFDEGTSRWATRRAQWRALGLTDDDMAKPKIAIVNSSSALAICFSHLDEIARRAKRAIERAGGVAFEVRTAAPSDFITSAGHRGGYILSARDLIVNDIEVAVEGALLDGMLCLASCDKTAPGQLMAAARLDIPTIIVACGYQPSGALPGPSLRHRGRLPGRRPSRPTGQLSPAGADRDERERDPRPRGVPGHGDREHDARRVRGARHGAARQHAGPGQQQADVGRGRAGRRPASWRWSTRTCGPGTS